MRIAIGSDPEANSLKQSILEYLSSTEHAYVDLGSNSEDSVDLSDYAKKRLCIIQNTMDMI